MRLSYVDHQQDPAAWAASLGVSEEAARLVAESDFIDLHCDLEVPVRVFGYKPSKRHGPWKRVVPFMGHTDYPRLREAGFTGIAYDLATNVFRRPAGRQAITLKNLARMKQQVEAWPEDLAVVRSASEYDAARAGGRTAMMLAIQGGNAFEHDPSVLDGPVGQDIHRITLVHLSSSAFGGSNSPSQPDGGITDAGRSFVARCNHNRILVDLSHAGKRTFWGALDAHSVDVPPIVSHTGVSGVREHWRNVDDDQLRAIAERDGVVGVIYQGNFLAPVPPGFACRRSAIIDHLQHIIDVAGERHAAIGTDYDGVITPPSDLTDVTHHPLLVQDMLDRGWSPDRIRGVLGGNYLRVLRAVRP